MSTSPTEPEAKKAKQTKLCYDCKTNDGVITCRREEDCRFGVDEDEPGPINTDKAKWPWRCLDCANAYGRICPVCELYHCRTCEEYTDEWHPECNLDIEWQKCIRCKKQACGGFHGFCYRACQGCPRTICMTCWDKKPEPGWSLCLKCNDRVASQADCWTGEYQLDYCPKCECDEHGKESHQVYKVEGEGNPESPKGALKKGDDDDDDDDEEEDNDDDDESDPDEAIAHGVDMMMESDYIDHLIEDEPPDFYCKVVISMINFRLENPSDPKKAVFQPVSKSLDNFCGMVVSIVSQPDIHVGAYAEKVFFDNVCDKNDTYPFNYFHTRRWEVYKNGNVVKNRRGWGLRAFVSFLQQGVTFKLNEVHEFGEAIKKAVDDMPDYDSNRVPCLFFPSDVEHKLLTLKSGGETGVQTHAITWADALGDFQTFAITRILLDEYNVSEYFCRNPELLHGFWRPGTMGLKQARALGVGEEWLSEEARIELSQSNSPSGKV